MKKKEELNCSPEWLLRSKCVLLIFWGRNGVGRFGVGVFFFKIKDFGINVDIKRVSKCSKQYFKYRICFNFTLLHRVSMARRFNMLGPKIFQLRNVGLLTQVLGRRIHFFNTATIRNASI